MHAILHTWQVQERQLKSRVEQLASKSTKAEDLASRHEELVARELEESKREIIAEYDAICDTITKALAPESDPTLHVHPPTFTVIPRKEKDHAHSLTLRRLTEAEETIQSLQLLLATRRENASLQGSVREASQPGGRGLEGGEGMAELQGLVVQMEEEIEFLHAALQAKEKTINARDRELEEAPRVRVRVRGHI